MQRKKNFHISLLLALFLLFTILSEAKSLRPPPEKDRTPTVTAPMAGSTLKGEEWQFFRMNAQSRGTVKKSFSNLGCAIAWFKDLSPDQTQIILHVSALHPEKKRQKYAFRLNLVFRREGARYSLVKREYAEFSGITGDRQTQLEQLAALWVYMRAYSKELKLLPEIEASGARLQLNEAVIGRGRSREINCSWPGRRGFNGKFFFERAVDPVFQELLALDKLRFKSGRLSVSLVKDSQEAVTRDFSTREPFAADVFK